MRHDCELRFSRAIQILLATCVVAVLLPASGHEHEETIPEPGFRPDSEYAPAFLHALDTATIAVYPTIVRRESRTAHSFASQNQIIAALSEQKMATIVSGKLRIDLGRLPQISQWDLFQNSLQRIAENLRNRQTVEQYHLFMELLLPVDHTVFAIQCYVLDQSGENVFSFLLNSHHRIFSDARLTANGTSQTARNELIEKATRVGVVALTSQVEKARERAALAEIVNPEKIEAGVLDDFALSTTSGSGGTFFHETPIDESSSILSFIEGDVGHGNVVERSMKLMCECAVLTLSKGDRYFSAEVPRESGDYRARTKINFYKDAPQDLPVLNPTKDMQFDAAPGNFVLDAEEISEYCDTWKRLKVADPATQTVSPAAAAADRRPPAEGSLCDDAAKVEYPINELPMYGHAWKTPEQQRADQVYIETMTRGGRSRQDAAGSAARLGWNSCYAADCSNAMRRFNQAWLLDPNNRLALWGFAVISMERGEIEEATRYFQMAITAGPEDPSLQRDYEAALSMLER